MRPLVRPALPLALLLLSACASVRPVPLVRHMRSPAASDTPSAPPDPGALAESLHLRCDDDACVEGVGMLVWRDALGEGLQRCTASLIGPDLALTASHCLPPSTRHVGAACGSMWMTFAEAPERPAEWVSCQSVLHASASPEATVLETDLAIIRLARPVAREPLGLAFVPTDASAIVSVVAIRPHPIYPSQHELSSRLCRVATRESAVEQFGADAARVGWLIDCPSYPGNSGAPILDRRGRIRAVLHGGSGPVDRIAITSDLGELPSGSIAGR